MSEIVSLHKLPFKSNKLESKLQTGLKKTSKSNASLFYSPKFLDS
jgi:hypothetical protein